jgi:7-keto-8-aminopelargonate synthetase-like enzyme
LRFTLKAGHNEEAIENLVAVLETEISKLRAN